tara:strand:- start:308 stop:547 length:240 start_codon:yes stop_codon:yes gene_type:complete
MVSKVSKKFAVRSVHPEPLEQSMVTSGPASTKREPGPCAKEVMDPRKKTAITKRFFNSKERKKDRYIFILKDDWWLFCD